MRIFFMQVFSKKIKTVLGEMIACMSDEGICMFDFAYRKMTDKIINRIETNLNTKIIEEHHPYFELLEIQLKEYFEGTRKEFDLPLHLIGTPFQIKVWQALQQIPYATTRSYKAQSVFLGNEKAIRAVAKANGENGIAIIIPCHRVIGENGSLIGYAGGLRNKQWLLDHERRHSGNTLQQSLF